MKDVTIPQLKVLHGFVRKIDVKKAFGAAIRTRRKQLGISQEELAERSDLHRTYISDVERGARNVSLENIERLAHALELSIADLFARDAGDE